MGKQPSISHGKPPKKLPLHQPGEFPIIPKWKSDVHVGYPLVNTQKYGKSRFLKGKSSMSMAIFNSCVSLQEGNHGEL